MGINEKITYLQETKELIRDAIEEKGVEVADTDSFRSYADKIKSIPQEGGDPYYENLYNARTSSGTNMAGLFARMNADSLDLSRLDTSKVTNMSYMFNYTTSNELDMSGWNTGNVKDMSYMFSNANIKNMDMSGWDTGKVTNMSYMYEQFRGQNIDFPFDMSNVTNAERMFYYCATPEIDLANWKGDSLTNVSELFSNCSSRLLNIQNLKFPKITSIDRMFYSYALKELDLSKFDISNITNMDYAFGFATSLVTLNLTNWKTNKVTTMNNTFYYMSYLEELIIPDWDMTNVTSSSSFMYNVSKLRYIDLSRSNDATIRKILSFLPTKKATEIGEILIPENTAQDIVDSLIAKYWKPIGPALIPTSFGIGTELDEIKPNSKTKLFVGTYQPWYTNVTFEDIEIVISDDSIVSINEELEIISNSITGSVEIYARLKENPDIVSNTITFSVSKTDSYPNTIIIKSSRTDPLIMINNSAITSNFMTYNQITRCYKYDMKESIKSIKFENSSITELVKLNVNNITSMSEMFYNCSSLTSLDLSSWDTSKVTNKTYMFLNVPSTCQIIVSDSLWTLTEKETGFTGTFIRV